MSSNRMLNNSLPLKGILKNKQEGNTTPGFTSSSEGNPLLRSDNSRGYGGLPRPSQSSLPGDTVSRIYPSLTKETQAEAVDSTNSPGTIPLSRHSSIRDIDETDAQPDESQQTEIGTTKDSESAKAAPPPIGVMKGEVEELEKSLQFICRRERTVMLQVPLILMVTWDGCRSIKDKDVHSLRDSFISAPESFNALAGGAYLGFACTDDVEKMSVAVIYDGRLRVKACRLLVFDKRLDAKITLPVWLTIIPEEDFDVLMDNLHAMCPVPSVLTTCQSLIAQEEMRKKLPESFIIKQTRLCVASQLGLKADEFAVRYWKKKKELAELLSKYGGFSMAFSSEAVCAFKLPEDVFQLLMALQARIEKQWPSAPRFSSDACYSLVLARTDTRIEVLMEVLEELTGMEPRLLPKGGDEFKKVVTGRLPTTQQLNREAKRIQESNVAGTVRKKAVTTLPAVVESFKKDLKDEFDKRSDYPLVWTLICIKEEENARDLLEPALGYLTHRKTALLVSGIENIMETVAALTKSGKWENVIKRAWNYPTNKIDLTTDVLFALDDDQTDWIKDPQGKSKVASHAAVLKQITGANGTKPSLVATSRH